MSSRERGHFFMAYIRGEAREQTTMFPATLDELIPVDHMCRVMEAFVGRLNMAKLGFVRAEPAETGRPGYDPRDLLKLYLYGYLEQVDAADEQDEVVIDPSAVQAALEKLQNDPEPEARFMRMGSGHAPAYNVQTAVDAEHALIVAHKITDTAGDNSLLLPMAEAALEALGHPESLHVVADAGYSNGEQAEACEAQGIVPHVPVTRAVNNQGDGTLFDRNEFHYDEKTDTFRCPANQTLTRKQLSRKDRAVYYAAKPDVCGACALKLRCTNRRQRLVSRHLHEDAFQRMQQRATPEMMRLRRSTVEHPFASLKYHIFGHPRFLLRGLKGAQTEISLATMVYNLKRMLNVSGGSLRAALVS